MKRIPAKKSLWRSLLNGLLALVFLLPAAGLAEDARPAGAPQGSIVSFLCPVQAMAQTSGADQVPVQSRYLKSISGQLPAWSGETAEEADPGLLRIASPQMIDRDRNYGDASSSGSAGSSSNRKISSCRLGLSRTVYTYDGNAKKPAVTVTYKGSRLSRNKDFTVSYSANRNAGTAFVTVRGKGKYSGKVTKSFRINKASQHFRIEKSSRTFARNELKTGSLSFRVKTTGAKGTLSWKSGSGYITVSGGKVTIRKNTPRGSYRVRVTASGTGNYKSAQAVLKITIR